MRKKTIQKKKEEYKLDMNEYVRRESINKYS